MHIHDERETRRGDPCTSWCDHRGEYLLDLGRALVHTLSGSHIVHPQPRRLQPACVHQVSHVGEGGACAPDARGRRMSGGRRVVRRGGNVMSGHRNEARGACARRVCEARVRAPSVRERTLVVHEGAWQRGEQHLLLHRLREYHRWTRDGGPGTVSTSEERRDQRW
jgi:hypothetical protein